MQSDQLNFQIKSLSEKNEQLEKQIQILVNEHKNEVKDLKDAQQLLLDDMKKNNKQLLEETKTHYESMLEDVESRRKKALNEGETQNARVHERMDEIDELNKTHKEYIEKLEEEKKVLKKQHATQVEDLLSAHKLEIQLIQDDLNMQLKKSNTTNKEERTKLEDLIQEKEKEI